MSSRPNSQVSMPQPRKPEWTQIFLCLLAYRICNALLLRTFFQPDEYYQSLEPAWQLAFGPDSGAWITWEWREQLRSSIHPSTFAAVYRLASGTSNLLSLGPGSKGDLLLAAPKVLQALFSALTDLYTGKLAFKVFRDDKLACIALAMSIFSPWQWFCSTRTLSNCLETTITSAALYHWRWHLSQQGLSSHDLPGLRMALVLAALGTILRPTNVIIWAALSASMEWQSSKSGTQQARTSLLVLGREATLCGSVVLMLSAISDRSFYGEWTLPTLTFLKFNVIQSLAVFYGRNRPDYYLTEGLPLLLTTYLPFALVGLVRVIRVANKKTEGNAKVDQSSTINALRTLVLAVLSMIGILSLIAHKEVRFIYPLLPALHVISVPVLGAFFYNSATGRMTGSKKALLACMFAANIDVASYTGFVHQRGVIDVTQYLRRKYEVEYLDGNGGAARQEMTVGFLMPCHSVPWRSHLVWPEIKAWALTCEPPLDLTMEGRKDYMDEADQFYANANMWLEQHMVDPPSKGVKGDDIDRPRNGSKRQWPDNLVFFEQLEPALKAFLSTSAYVECWRGFNTHVHDDSRRKGDVIVWCLDSSSQGLTA